MGCSTFQSRVVTGNVIGSAVIYCAFTGIAEAAGQREAVWAQDAPPGITTALQLATLPNLRVFLQNCIVYSRRKGGTKLEATFLVIAVDLDCPCTTEQADVVATGLGVIEK